MSQARQNFYLTSSSNKELKSSISKYNSAARKNPRMNSIDASTEGSAYEDITASLRPGYDRSNYNQNRPLDAVPTEDHKIMRACRNAYEKVGIIRSVIDLMIEIAIEGMEIVSTNDSLENFYRNWAHKTNLVDRAEKFANHFLVEGNVVVRRRMGELETKTVRKMKRGNSLTAETKNLPADYLEPGMIPIDYVFYDPSTIDLVGDELAALANYRKYGLKVTSKTIAKLAGVDRKHLERIIPELPEEVRSLITSRGARNAISTGNFIVIPIPENRVYVAHYKKCDSDVWAKSFIYSILNDVVYNEKLRLAKISALDGFYNSIRLWKLGDHTNEIWPGELSFERLGDVLQEHPGGVLDVIWDSAIELEDFYPPVERLQNFDESVDSILLGMGIHGSLVGGSEGGSNASNTFIGLRNMIKRIDGLRRALTRWLDTEFEVITKNMGFQNKPQVKFSVSNLFDQQTYFKLLVDLADRDIISGESVLNKIGEMSDLERRRIKEESEHRKEMDVPQKRSSLDQPYIPKNNTERQKELAKFNHELSRDNSTDAPYSSSRPDNGGSGGGDPEKNSDGPGRPAGSPDTQPRNRRFRSGTAVASVLKSSRIQDKLDKIVDDTYLVYNKIGNKRQLSSEQRQELNRAKTEMLASLSTDTFSNIDEVSDLIEAADSTKTNEFMSKYNSAIADEKYSADEERLIKSQIHAEVYDNE
jgi:hypothetical protein